MTFSHENNYRFQYEVYSFFYGKDSLFTWAPVKTYDRCLIKSNTDYSSHSYPTSASILDFMRCSITFKDITLLFNGLNNFVNAIKNNQFECLKKILRIKNGFTNTLNWKSYLDSEYCDIKLNVLYMNELETQCQLVECQFLLSSLLKAKKFGHKYYGVKRRKSFIDSIHNIIYNENSDIQLYKGKIISMINQDNLSLLSKEIFLKPNVIMSLIEPESSSYSTKSNQLLLYWIARESTYKFKLLHFFVECLFHYGEIILNEKFIENNSNNDSNDNNSDSNSSSNKQENDKLFLTRYLNFKKTKGVMSIATFVCGFIYSLAKSVYIV